MSTEIGYLKWTGEKYEIDPNTIIGPGPAGPQGNDGQTSYTYQLVTQVNNAFSSTPVILGNVYFNPETIIPTSSGKTRNVVFKAIVKAAAGYPIYLQLYDIDGITGDVGLISGSLIGPKTDLTSTYYEVNITSDLGTVVSPGILECWMWTSDATTNPVVCSMSKIDIDWT